MLSVSGQSLWREVELMQENEEGTTCLMIWFYLLYVAWSLSESLHPLTSVLLLGITSHGF